MKRLFTKLAFVNVVLLSVLLFFLPSSEGDSYSGRRYDNPSYYYGAQSYKHSSYSYGAQSESIPSHSYGAQSDSIPSHSYGARSHDNLPQFYGARSHDHPSHSYGARSHDNLPQFYSARSHDHPSHSYGARSDHDHSSDHYYDRRHLHYSNRASDDSDESYIPRAHKPTAHGPVFHPNSNTCGEGREYRDGKCVPLPDSCPANFKIVDGVCTDSDGVTAWHD